MIRIADIFKKYKEEKKKIDLGSSDFEQSQDSSSSKKNAVPSNKLSVSSAVHKELDRLINTDVGELYESVLTLARRLYKPAAEFEKDILPSIGTAVEKMADLLIGGNQDLLRISLADYLKSEDYPYYHALNVCIISLEIGLGAGYERLRLIELGKVSFIHDFAISQFFNSPEKKHILEKEELEKIKDYPNVTLDILTKFTKELSGAVLELIGRQQENLQVFLPAAGLNSDRILEYARIVILADVYETMTHQRPYRNKYTPLETIKNILDNKSAFDPRGVKSLIERVGIFPVGTLVRLNTNEIGMVLKENPQLPLRPSVKILCDAYGREVKESKMIDLSDNSMIYIEESLKS